MTPAHRRAVHNAKRIVEEYAIRTPADIDIEAIAYDRGLFVTDGLLAGSWARLVRKGNGGIIRVSTAIEIAGQRRFCVAHELGHFTLHQNVDQLEFCTSTDMLPGYARRPEEPEANAFAAEILMPEDLFRDRLNPTDLNLTQLQAIAGDFMTTISATIYRLVDVSVHVCALVRSENGRLRSFHACHDFPFRIREMRSRLDGRSCAGEFFRDGKVEAHEAEVPADAWLEDRRITGRETVRELTVLMPNYGSTLTVLWVVPGSKLDYAAAD